MSNFQRLIKSLKIDHGSFNAWFNKVQNPKTASPHKRLFDTYDRSLRRCEIFDADLQAWMMRHVDDPEFEKTLKAKDKRFRELEALSVGRLRRIFDAYLREVQKYPKS